MKTRKAWAIIGQNMAVVSVIIGNTPKIFPTFWHENGPGKMPGPPEIGGDASTLYELTPG
ncbi:hypothetical protein D3C73_727100 [compost metagenome]